MDDLIAENREQLPELKASLMARVDHIFNQALENENLKTALESINLQAKIGGIYDKKEVVEEKTPDIITVKKRDNVTHISEVKKSENE